MRPKSKYGRRSSEAGFSLVELLVTVVIMAEILVGVAILFDSSNRLARSQSHLAELQQSLRVGQSEIVRFARMAGIGGLPITRLNFQNSPPFPVPEPNASPPNYDLLGAFPRSGYAVAVLNNVAAGTTFTNTVTGATAEVLAGSDVLILRGVFTTPLYYFDPPLDISSWLDTLPVDDKDVVISNRVRTVSEVWEDYPQDIDALGERLTAALGADPLHQKVALILRDTLNPNAYAIMEFDPDTAVMDLNPAQCAAPSPPYPDETCFRSMSFKLHLNETAEPGLSYGKLTSGTGLQPGSGGMTLTLPAGSDPPSTDPFPVELPTTIGSIGLLEEYRFFVRVEHEVPGDSSTRLTPVLSRASFLPGTAEMIDRVDIADNVIDLQIAVGADADLPGTGGYGNLTENTSGVYAADEILFNETGDTDGLTGDYTAPPGDAVNWYDPTLEFHFLRINTLVQSRFPDNRHLAPGLGNIEDYNRGATVTLGSTRYNDEIRYHRRWLQTVVELRNLL